METNVWFADYMITKYRTGDVGLDSNRRPVLDNTRMNGYSESVTSRNDLQQIKTPNDFRTFGVNGDPVVGMARPLTNSELTRVFDNLKPGQVAQVYRDTNPLKSAGGNHYYLVMKGEDGVIYDMNHVVTKDKTSGDFPKFDFKNPTYGVYYAK